MIFVAIGANLPGSAGETPLDTCVSAVRSMQALPRLQFVGLSKWYASAPFPASNQPNYINGVAAFAGSIAPDALLFHLQSLERGAGRVRSAPNDARPLDLDVIDMDGLIRDTPDPILPHPRAHLRRFVLEPLRDLAPDWVHPRQLLSVTALLELLPPQDVWPA